MGMNATMPARAGSIRIYPTAFLGCVHMIKAPQSPKNACTSLQNEPTIVCNRSSVALALSKIERTPDAAARTSTVPGATRRTVSFACSVAGMFSRR